MKKKLIVFLLALVSCIALAFSLAACDSSGKTDDGTLDDGGYHIVKLDFTLNDDNASYSVTAALVCVGNVVIPSTYNNLPVTSIGDEAFSDCSRLTGITIPDSVTYIGNSAFDNCSKLTNVVIGNGVTYIDYWAFDNCSKLTNITVDENNNYYKSIDGNLYNKGGTTLIRYAIGKTDTSFIIPDGVTSIDDGAFEDCSELTSISIPDSVTYIGDWAFGDCGKLTSITIPDGVTYIGDWAFEDCSELTNVVIGNGVTSIGGWAFYNCSKLTSITIPGNVTYIGYEVFENCTAEIIWSNPTITEIGYAFQNYRGTSITIPDSVNSIDNWAFHGCSKLTNVVIGNSVTYIGDMAFENCSELTNVVIGNSVTYIGDWAFEDCSSLTTITIPDGITYIGDMAFENCTSLTYNEYDNAYYLGNETNPFVVLIKAKDNDIISCSINSNTKIIYDYAFDDCRQLTTITIPDGITYIGDYAFDDCSELTYNEYDNAYYLGNETNPFVVLIKAIYYGIPFCSINSNTKIIYDYAFGYYSELTGITIPNSVTYIGYRAFSNCSNLTNITVDENNNYYKSIDGNLYNKGGTKLIQYAIGKTDTSFIIPDSVTYIGDWAFGGCNELTSITIPDSVTYIGYDAFGDCSELTNITFNGTKEQWNMIGDDIINIRPYTIHCTDGDIVVYF